MKRFMGAALCTALALCLAASASQAATWQERTVPFVIKRSAVASTQWDSVNVTRGAARTDTSAAFIVPNIQTPGIATSADTLKAFIISWAPVNPQSDPNSIAIASGTTTISLQGSEDHGGSWAALTPTSATLTASGTGAYAHTVSAINRKYDAFRVIMNSAATGTYNLRIKCWAP